MQYALNAMVVDLDRGEADAIRGLAGVRFVEDYKEYEVANDRGPPLIGAEPVRNGSTFAGQASGTSPAGWTAVK